MTPVPGQKRSLGLLLGYMAVILVLSLIPGSGTTGDLLGLIPSTIQNFLHVPAYALLAVLCVRTLATYRMGWRWRLTTALVLASTYGAAMEFSQTWAPGRVPSVLGFLLNLAGVVLGVGLFGWLTFGRFRPPRSDRIVSKAGQG